jgi:hypothetical protein
MYQRSYLIFSFAVLILCLSFLSSCEPPPLPEAHFVIPNNYKGSFILVVDPMNGTEIEPDKGGIYNYVIPKEAVLKIQNAPPPFNGVKLFAEYEDGTKIPAAYSINMFPKETLALFGPSEVPGPTGMQYVFVVTTTGEMKQSINYKEK